MLRRPWVLRRPCTDAALGCARRGGHAVQENYNVEAQCTPTRSALLTGRLPIRTGCYSVPFPGQGEYGLAPWEYTLAELLSDGGYATAAFGKWHVGDADGRLPTDQGFDESYGIKDTSDESLYSTHPLFAESGAEVPKIWEGVVGSPVTPASDYDLMTRPLIDEQIATRAAAFIKRSGAAGTPFFTYVCFTAVHPPCSHTRTSSASREVASTRMPSPSSITAPAKCWTRSRRRVSPRSRLWCGPATTRRPEGSPRADPMARGEAASGPASRAACALPRWCGGRATFRPASSPTRSPLPSTGSRPWRLSSASAASIAGPMASRCRSNGRR